MPGPLATDCWQWPGAKSSQGYPYIRGGGKVVTVYRLLYRVLVGPVPKDRELHHRCEDCGCVNPHHLEPLKKPAHGRRHWHAECVRGHRLTRRNRLRNGHGCRLCYRARKKARYQRLRDSGLTSAQARSRA